MTVLLSAQNLSKAYGPRPLFADISLDLRAGERVGLIGPNGAGKSTLLRILTGLETPDTGTVTVRRTVRLGYLSQQDAFDADRTVREVLTNALRDDPAEEHERATRIEIALGKAGFSSENPKTGSLSGGWRKRLAVARELVCMPDLVLLDEPTNHLDLEGILWLEELLGDAPFAYVVVSHDRYFLENVTNQIVELDRVYPAGCFRVDGTYSVFLSRREEFLAGQARQEQSLASKVRREVEWLQRGAQARTGKSSARTQEAQRLIGDLRTVKARNAPAGAADLDFAATGRRTAKLVVAEGLAKTLGGRPLFGGLSFMLSPGMKLGLLGPNGSGKSTLLRILAGEMVPDAGKIVRAEGVRVVTFDQDRRHLDPTATLRQALSPNSDTVVIGGRPMHVTAWAKRFLFRPEQLELPVGDLSGGEQARVLLARLMLQPADVLLLDEPTNDLDLATLEVLEDGLSEFPGALVLVTHDRSLLDRLCTEILGLDGAGGARMFADYSQWVNARRDQRALKPKAAAKADKPARFRPRRLTYPEQRELDTIEERVHEAERALAVRQKEVEAVGNDHVRLAESCRAMQAAQEEVEKLYERWQELESKLTSP